MDPNATLSELRDLLLSMQETRERAEVVDPEDIDRSIELFNALDAWIGRGGFLPTAWLTSSMN